MGFTHSWNGTVLTITSDSGTSSADLQGPVGDTGPRGPQGVGGDGSGINLSDYYTKTEVDGAIAEIADVDTSTLATKEYVSSAIASAQLEGAEVDLSAYYTKSETDAAISNATPDLTNYYTKTQVDSAIETALDNFEVPALPEDDVHLDGTLYYTKDETYTKQEVDAKIAEAQLEGAGVDMSGYYTKTEVDAAINNIDIPETDLSNYYTKTEVDSLVSSSTGSNVDLSNYYTKSETYTKTEVDNAISTATGNVDLSNYYTKTEIAGLGHITEAQVVAKGYLTEAEVLALIQANIPTYTNGDEVSY